jgi:hypothetical protein
MTAGARPRFPKEFPKLEPRVCAGPPDRFYAGMRRRRVIRAVDNNRISTAENKVSATWPFACGNAIAATTTCGAPHVSVEFLWRRCCEWRHHAQSNGACAGKLAPMRVGRHVARFGTSRAATGGQPGGASAHALICAPNGTNQKHLYRTKCYEESVVAVACYLCNTRPKTV